MLECLNAAVPCLWHPLVMYVGYGVIILCLMAVLVAIFKKKYVCIAHGSDGEITLTKRALVEIIESVCYDMDVSGKVRTSITGGRRGIHVSVTVKTDSWQNLADKSSMLQSRLQHVLVNNIGLVTVSKINIVIVGFLFKKPGAQGSRMLKRLEIPTKVEEPKPVSYGEPCCVDCDVDEEIPSDENKDEPNRA